MFNIFYFLIIIVVSAHKNDGESDMEHFAEDIRCTDFSECWENWGAKNKNVVKMVFYIEKMHWLWKKAR